MAGEGAAAGAAIGTAIMPGVGTAIGGLAGSFLDGKSGGGSGGGGYEPKDASQAVYGGLGLDGSGWNLNFSGTQSNGSNKAGQPSLADTLGVNPAGIMGSISPLMIVGVVAVFGLVLWTKSRSKK